MQLAPVVVAAALSVLFTTAASAADAETKFEDCPLLGPIADYVAQGQPQWENWDEEPFVVPDADGEKEIQVDGAVCIQDYPEVEGKNEGSILEITENYKQALQQLGAELKVARPG